MTAEAGPPRRDSPTVRPPRWMVVTSALGLLAIGLAGAWLYVAQRGHLEQVASANLTALAQAKLDLILAWHAERLGDAQIIQESPYVAPAVARWRAGRQPEAAADILTRLRSNKSHYGYANVRLVDPAGRVLLATNGLRGALDADEAETLRAAFRDQRATMSDVYVSSGDTVPRLAVVAPLFTWNGRTSVPVGAVVHEADPRQSLFRLVASWASPSGSTEALLVQRDGDSVRVLTASRFRLGAAPGFHIALSRTDVPAVMAALGTEGVVRGVDYRGVRVISALRAVPGTPWFLVVKVDEAEALAVWRTEAALVFAVLLGLVLVAGATVHAVAQRSAKAHYRRLYEAEAALSASEERYRLLFDGITDAVFVHGLSDDGLPAEFLAVNDAACARLGYTREELLRMTVRDIDAPESPVDVRAIVERLKRGETVLGEQTHVTKDGRRIPVEIHVQSFPLHGRPVALSVVRDITERKRADEALREAREHLEIRVQERTLELEQANCALEEEIAERQSAEEAVKRERQRLYDVLETLPVYVLLLTADYHVPFANRFFRERFGESAGRRCYEYLFHRDAPCETCETFTVLKTAAPHQWEWIGPDGRNYDNFDFPFTGDGGAPLILEMGIDVTERMRAEKTLQRAHNEMEQRVAERTDALRRVNEELRTDITKRQQAEEEVKTILRTTLDGYYLVDEAGEFLDTNDSYCQMIGYSREELLTMDVKDIEAVDTDEAIKQRIQSIMEVGYSRFETQHRRKDGGIIDIEASVNRLRGGQAKLVVFMRDITKRKRGEEALRNRESMLQKVFDLIPVGLWFADKEGTLLRGNPEGVRIWGAEPRVAPSEYGIFKARRLPSREEVAPDDWALAHTIRDKVTIVDELLEIEAFDGTKKTILNYSAPVLDAQGEVQGAIVVNQDITERQRAEAAMRALARHLNAVREEEHTRIAREIHDELGQALTALRLDLVWLGRKLPRGSKALRGRLDGAVQLTDEMITVGQRIAGNLRPPILDDLGLVPAVEWYAQQFAKRSGLLIALDVGAEEPVVTAGLAITAYRIVQEALTNVARHARATHVTVRIRKQDRALAIEIRDDGQGFPEEAAIDPRSFGIVGMRERAAAHGGMLAITSSPGTGTTVRVIIPLERRKEPRTPQ